LYLRLYAFHVVIVEPKSIAEYFEGPEFRSHLLKITQEQEIVKDIIKTIDQFRTPVKQRIELIHQLFKGIDRYIDGEVVEKLLVGYAIEVFAREYAKPS
jgi:hypothetical protein